MTAGRYDAVMSDPALRLIGPPRLLLPGGRAVALGPRRSHQLLAVLGWHGSQACGQHADTRGDTHVDTQGEAAGWVLRDDLAELLWPDSRQAQARTNLRKLLMDLRQSGLAVPDEDAGRLRWRPGTDIDAFAAACAGGQWLAAALAGSGVLLEGMDLSGGGPNWLSWLHTQRRRHQQRWREAAARALPGAPLAQAAQLSALLLQADPQDAAGLAGTQLQAAQAASTLAPLAPLVGRQGELEDLLALVQRSRLVTLLGPGGVGKSRLARHAADRLAPQFLQGAAVVKLDDLSTPGALPARVADTLGLVLPPHADAALALSRLLAARSMLLVLDGFEAVVDGADMVPRLLAAAPGLRLLVTSRERLDVDGECLLPLASLAVPPTTADAAQALASPAVRLFIERARAVQPLFDAGQNWPAMADICCRVGGLPLAIEWAAAWMRVLSAAELAQEIAERLAVDGDTGPVAVFESSWRLLTHSEREAYAALAVFRGGFTRLAAREVAGVGVAQLAALVDKSMLRTPAEGRFDMHPLVHAHARSKLAGLASAPALAAQHARWYLALLQRSQPLPPLENENVLAAWHQAVQQRDAPAVTAAIGRIQWSALVEGRRAEAVALLQGAAACFGTDTTTGAELQAHQAWILLWLDGDPQACRLANDAAPVLRAAGHSRGLAMCLRTLGHAARRACQPTLAARHFEDALDLPEVDGGPSLRATLHDALGMALLQAGDIDAARVQFEQALALNLACGDEVQRMYNHLNLADAHACAGQPARALPMARAALAIGSACGFPLMLPYVQAQLARVWVALGRQPEGLLAAGQAVARAHETGDASALACALDAQARAALLGGDVAAARQALRDAVRWALRTRNLALGPLLLSTARQAFADLALASGWSQLAAPHLLAQLGADLEVDPVDPVEPGA